MMEDNYFDMGLQESSSECYHFQEPFTLSPVKYVNQQMPLPLSYDENECYLGQMEGEDMLEKEVQNEPNEESCLDEFQAFEEEEIEQEISSLALLMNLNEDDDEWHGITIIYEESKEPTNLMDPFLEGFKELQSGCFHARFTNFHPQMSCKQSAKQEATMASSKLKLQVPTREFRMVFEGPPRSLPHVKLYP